MFPSMLQLSKYVPCSYEWKIFFGTNLWMEEFGVYMIRTKMESNSCRKQLSSNVWNREK
jgi:hypothetical protein